MEIITENALKQRIGPLLKTFWANDTRTYAGFADQFYSCPGPDEVKKILEIMSLPSPQDEVYDCDDYAFELKAHASRYARLSDQYSNSIALGIAWGRFSWVSNGQLDHACNWIFDSSKTFFWIEPQNKKLYNLTQCSGRLSLIIV